ncbi:MAG: hypothetical protein ACYC01_13115, partial [Lutibacter sp.]
KTRFVFLSKLRGILFGPLPKQESLLHKFEEFTRQIHYLFIISTIAGLNSKNQAINDVACTRIFVWKELL